MTTRSFLDAMRSNDALDSAFQSPLHQAQSLVSKDDYEGLKPLLALPGGEDGGPIKETDFVNPSVNENLLHFAVRQLAANCVHILVHPPFNWNPDRRNVLESSALDLAMRNRHSYLPVVWSLAFASSEAVPEPSPENFSLTHLLLRPPTTDLSFDQILGLCSMDFSGAEYKKKTLLLLFELIRCMASSMLPENLRSIRPECCLQCKALGETTEALCLENEEHQPFDLPVRYSCWLWHQYKGFPSLLDCCRTTIRQQIVRNLLNTDYAKALKSLHLPSRMIAFLAFRESWPVLDLKHAFDFRRGKKNTPIFRRIYPDVIDVMFEQQDA
ncbi:unnamed protein product [Hymenolepis diminuta]|uniref:SOCS box domain-containing protein n=2 Tax=Hymenolepis diminuta TaxID=6216 RepID=A0A564YBG4_HYMDI|nr:unnamed protein product [Hymenolepis diminuta]